MIWLLFITLLVIVVVVIGAIRQKKIEPINVREEINMPIHFDSSERNKIIAYTYLAGWVIKKNAKSSENKINFVHAYFKQVFKQVDVEIGVELTNALKYSINIRSIARWVLKRMGSGEERLNLVNFLIELSFVDGDIIDREVVAITRFSELIGVHVGHVEKTIFNRRKLIYEKEENGNFIWIKNSSYHIKKAYLLLQLEEDASQIEVKRAFRKLAARYHPDKFQDVSEEERLAATQKFIQIKEAYDFLMD